MVNIHHEVAGYHRITRPAKYSNPVALGKPCPVCGATHERPGIQALLCYGSLLLPRLRAERGFASGLHELEGKPLGCVCVRYDQNGVRDFENHCHGDLLVAYIDGYSERLGKLCGAGVPTRSQRVAAHEDGLAAVDGHLAWLRRQAPAQLLLPRNRPK